MNENENIMNNENMENESMENVENVANNEAPKEPLFSLEVPSEEEIKEEVQSAMVVKEEDKARISTQAETAVMKIMSVDLTDIQNRNEVAKIISDFGLNDLNTCKRTNEKNAILQNKLITFDKAGNMTGLGEISDVTKGLEDLTIKMKDLDPSGLDFAKTGPLGKLFNPVRRYFEKYKTADQEIATIIQSLEKGKKTLLQDNTTLEREEVAMRGNSLQMLKNVEMGTQLKQMIEGAVTQARADGVDPEKIRFVEEEVLYPLNQRIEDFQQVGLVSQQGVIATEIIRRNNKELIRSVDRAQNVTVTALRTAVMVAGALYNQKITLEKVNSLNTATNQIMQSTSKMLHTQGVEIQKQASEAVFTPDTLQVIFEETLQALEDISNYKQQALPQMTETIKMFRQLADKGESEIQKMEKTVMDIDLLPKAEDVKNIMDGNEEA